MRWRTSGAVQGAAQIRMTPSRPGVQGQPSVAGCTLNTTAGSPPPPLPAPPPPLAPTIVVNAGDNQIGISGRLLSDPLSVEVVDGAGQPVLGAAIAWSVGSGVQADVEPWAYRSMGGRLDRPRVRADPVPARLRRRRHDPGAHVRKHHRPGRVHVRLGLPARARGVRLQAGGSARQRLQHRPPRRDARPRRRRRRARVDADAGPAARGQVTWKTTRGDRGRITKVDSSTVAYDGNGNLVTDTQSRTYPWDAWNRLVEITHGGQTLVSYTYDHVGRLISRKDSSGEEDFVYDGWRLIEVRRGGSVVERYVWGLPGELLAVGLGTARYTVLTRPDGCVDCLVDAHQKVVERYDYTAFGSIVVRDRPASSWPRRACECSSTGTSGITSRGPSLRPALAQSGPRAVPQPRPARRVEGSTTTRSVATTRSTSATRAGLASPAT